MTWAVIGGSGPLAVTDHFEPVAVPDSAYGAPSGPVRKGRLGATDVLFMARHGEPRRVAPHQINYRANIDTLLALGAEGIIALNTVGGITPAAVTGAIVVADQIVDYTWGREQTFSDDDNLLHADFADPVDAAVQRRLVAAAATSGVDVVDGGVYGCSQGPRFETAAEVRRMARDGCDLAGMTAMPEAVLARERGVPYAMLSLVVNPAAGLGADVFNLDEIARVASDGGERLGRLLAAFFEGGEGV